MRGENRGKRTKGETPPAHCPRSTGGPQLPRSRLRARRIAPPLPSPPPPVRAGSPSPRRMRDMVSRDPCAALGPLSLQGRGKDQSPSPRGREGNPNWDTTGFADETREGVSCIICFSPSSGRPLPALLGQPCRAYRESGGAHQGGHTPPVNNIPAPGKSHETERQRSLLDLYCSEGRVTKVYTSLRFLQTPES